MRLCTFVFFPCRIPRCEEEARIGGRPRPSECAKWIICLKLLAFTAAARFSDDFPHRWGSEELFWSVALLWSRQRTKCTKWMARGGRLSTVLGDVEKLIRLSCGNVARLSPLLGRQCIHPPELTSSWRWTTIIWGAKSGSFVASPNLLLWHVKVSRILLALVARGD